MTGANEETSERIAGADADAAGPTPPDAGEARRALAEKWLADHGELLWRFLLSRSGTVEAAEEVLQETILAALQNASTYSGASSERTWLLSIAGHKLTDQIRRRRRDRRSVSNFDESARGAQGGAGADVFGPSGKWAVPPRDWGGDPADGAMRAEALAALRACLEALPPDLAQAVFLRDLLELTTAETCEALGLTATNLWTRTHRARAALRICVERALRERQE